jgi:hypothetical protein
VQTARRYFLDDAARIDDPGSAYTWIRTVAFRSMVHEYRAHGRSTSLDPGDGEVGGAVVAKGPGSVEELIDLRTPPNWRFCSGRSRLDSLSDQRRQIFVL